MVYCWAYNCCNSTEKGFRLFRFPANEKRSKQWLINSKRNGKITRGSYLCEVHFDRNQFENHRLDGRRKLRPDAVPTIFNVSNSLVKRTLSSRKSKKHSDIKSTVYLKNCEENISDHSFSPNTDELNSCLYIVSDNLWNSIENIPISDSVCINDNITNVAEYEFSQS